MLEACDQMVPYGIQTSCTAGVLTPELLMVVSIISSVPVGTIRTQGSLQTCQASVPSTARTGSSSFLTGLARCQTPS